MNLLARLVFALFWLWGAVVFYTPFFVKNFIAELVARIWFYLIPLKKKILLNNLVFIFPRDNQESMDSYKERIEALALRNMHHTFLSVLELFERFHWSDRVLEKKVLIEGAPFFYQQTKAKKGFFILTAHLGNWELITRVGAYLKIRLHIITKRLRNSFFDQIWIESRTSFGLGLLKEEGSGLSVIRAVQKGASVGFILDQHTGLPHGILADFMGGKAWCPKGLAILSSRLKAPVLYAFIKRLPDGRHLIRIGDTIDFSELDNEQYRDSKTGHLNEQGVLRHIEICNQIIDRFIRETPEQYLWIHRRFKESLSYAERLPWEL